MSNQTNIGKHLSSIFNNHAYYNQNMVFQGNLIARNNIMDEFLYANNNNSSTESHKSKECKMKTIPTGKNFVLIY